MKHRQTKFMLPYGNYALLLDLLSNKTVRLYIFYIFRDFWRVTCLDFYKTKINKRKRQFAIITGSIRKGNHTKQ
jgi:hypothetical protein